MLTLTPKINFKSDNINFNPKRTTATMPQDMNFQDMSLPDDGFIMQNEALRKAERREKNKENWQKTGVIAQAFLAAAFSGLLVMDIVKHKANKRIYKLQEAQIKKQFPNLFDETDKNLSDVFKDLSKDTSIPDLTADSINPKVKKFIKETIEAFNVKPEIAKYSGSENPPRMLILWGPTGTGKTFTAKIFAKAQGAEYTEVQFSDVSSKYVGETAVFISNKFKEFAELAKANPDKKYVVAFNEIDSLINNVEKLGENNLHLGQNRTSFLNGIDSIKDIPNLSIVGTTNIDPKSAKLDSATLGRFGNIFEIPLPTKEELRASLTWQLKKCEAVTKYNFMENNKSKINKLLDTMVQRNCAHRDVETISKGALNKFKLAIKDNPRALEQRFDIKYLEEALNEKEVIASGIGRRNVVINSSPNKPSLLQRIKDGIFFRRTAA